MKKLLMFILLVAGAWTAQAQRPAMQAVDASTVPDSVKNAQAKTYAGITVTKWESRSGKRGTHYLAEFTDKNNIRTKARYDASGKLIATTRFYGPSQLPATVVTASARYSGYKVVMAEEIISAKKNKSWYSVRLRDAASAKMTVLLDENGNEVTPDKAPEEVRPEPAPASGN